jgi:hypothetical protein
MLTVSQEPSQKRLNPEVFNIFGAAACYRQAKVGSSHDDAHPDNTTLHSGKTYSFFLLHVRRFVLHLLLQRRGAAATAWAPRPSTCKNQQTAPRASTWVRPDISSQQTGKIYLFRCESAEFFFSCCDDVVAAATTWTPRSSTCKNQRAAPWASA